MDASSFALCAAEVRRNVYKILDNKNDNNVSDDWTKIDGRELAEEYMLESDI